ncbi:hypothetical protein GCM10027062_40930 [Nocardioides hungaricus]
MDPDYIPPEVLRERALAKGNQPGDITVGTRPLIRRRHDQIVGAVRIAPGRSGAVVEGSGTTSAGVDVRHDVDHVVLTAARRI